MAFEPPPESYIFDKFKGLRNTVGADRLAPDELAVAKNIDLDDAGQARRRRGYTKVGTGVWHSLFTGTLATYVVKDGTLGKLAADYSFNPLWGGIGPAPLAYVQVGDMVYFASATSSGKVTPEGIVATWGEIGGDNLWVSPVVNPTATLPAIGGRLLGAPPMATALTYFNSRIYLANERTVWATLPFLYNQVDKTSGYLMFEDEITLFGAVSDGIYVGTKSMVWFLTGPAFPPSRSPVMSYGALPGSVVEVPAELVAPQSPSKNAVMFLTKSGLVVGLDGGQIINLTQTRVLFPAAESAAAMFRRQDGTDQYIGVMDSGGTPTSSARIGDYVEAEIRRFQP